MVVHGLSWDNMMIKNKPKKVVMIEANDTEVQVQQNTVDIKLVQQDLRTIKNVHLKTIETDLRKIDKKIEKVDLRLWGIMFLIVGSTLAHYFM